MRRLCVALLCGLLLGGCFFSLDGSLVNKKRDGGGDTGALDGGGDTLALDGARDGAADAAPLHADLPAKDASPQETTLPDAVVFDAFQPDLTPPP